MAIVAEGVNWTVTVDKDPNPTVGKDPSPIVTLHVIAPDAKTACAMAAAHESVTDDKILSVITTNASAIRDDGL